MVPVLGELATAVALTALPSTVDTRTGPREWRGDGAVGAVVLGPEGGGGLQQLPGAIGADVGLDTLGGEETGEPVAVGDLQRGRSVDAGVGGL